MIEILWQINVRQIKLKYTTLFNFAFHFIAVPEEVATDDRITYKFLLAGITKDEIPKLAELRMKPVHPGNTLNLRGRHKLRIAVYDTQNRLLQKQAHRVVYRYDDVTKDNVYDITDIVEKIIKTESSTLNVTVHVTLKTRSGNDKSRSKRSIEEKAKENGLLVIYTKDTVFFKQYSPEHLFSLQEPHRKNSSSSSHKHLHGHGTLADHHHRTKRSRKDGSRKGLCEKKDFYVDFEEVGWGQWIVYPKRFNAFICDGKCPTPVDQIFEPTNHAIMQSLMRIAQGKKQVPRPCCVPSKLHPLSMLYYEYGEIVVRHHEGMIVDACGCR